LKVRKFIRPTLVAGAIAAAFVAGAQLKSPAVPAATAASAPSAVIAPAAASTRALPDFTDLVERHGAAVVNIAVVKRAQGMPAQFDPNDMEGPMGEMLRRFGIPNHPGRQFGPRGPQGPEGRGVGSGFIVTSDGLILTNAHVVEGASELRVRLADQREFTGKVLGADKLTDVAVVKVEAKDLPTVKLGNPANLKVGEWVAAIGSPFGLESTVTAGIVSAKSRSLPDERLVPFIQTDVAVNPGNSGGPLFNMTGEVVGINSQIFSTSGGYMGLSFAIPIDLAIKVKDQLVKDGKVTRGRIGVAIQSVDQPLARSSLASQPQRRASRKAMSSSSSLAARSTRHPICRSRSPRPRRARTSQSRSGAIARKRRSTSRSVRWTATPSPSRRPAADLPLRRAASALRCGR
jgi:serine protease Do